MPFPRVFASFWLFASSLTIRLRESTVPDPKDSLADSSHWSIRESVPGEID